MKHLGVIPFRNLFNWSVAYHLSLENPYSNKYPLVTMGEILRRNKTVVNVKDDIAYKRVTISTLGKGVSVRDKLIGKFIGTKKQFAIKPGQFIVSKIDARNGAFGVVPQEADDAIITGNFWTFDVDYNQIDPFYLALLTRTKEFTAFCEKASNGTTNRHYLQEHLFLSQQIPLPSIAEQNKIVAAYNDTLTNADKCLQESRDINDQIEAYLYKKLSMQTMEEKQINTSLTYLHFFQFKNIKEWGFDKILGTNNKLLYSSVYPNVKLGDVLQINPRTELKSLIEDTEISFIPMECVSDNYGEVIKKMTCKKAESKGYTKFTNGDIIWARITPCMQNGKSAVVTNLVNNYGCGSTEFHVLRNNDININTLYIHHLLRMPVVLKDAQKSFTGSAGQQRVPKNYLENLRIPLPPLYLQNEIVEHIAALRTEQKELRQKALLLRQQATQQFEQTIFN